MAYEAVESGRNPLMFYRFLLRSVLTISRRLLRHFGSLVPDYTVSHPQEEL